MVREGYKQTEVGVLPEDWNVISMGSFSKTEGGYAFKSTKFLLSGKYQVIKMSNLYGGNLDLLRSRSFLNELDKLEEAYLLCENDILITLTGTVGKQDYGYTTIIKNESNLLLNQRVGRIMVGEIVDASYLFYQTKSPAFNSQFFELSKGGTGNQTNVGTKDIDSVCIPFPPTKAEQKAIAEALSDVDGLIDGLEKLIAKKRDMKTATMQQLLTGKTRLPGFGGEWTEISMDGDAILKARIGWQALTTEEYLDSGNYFLVTGTDFINGRIRWSSCHYVDEWRYSQDKNIQLRNSDVLLTKDGTIGKVGYVDHMTGPATLNSGVFVIRPIDNSFDPLFLYYILSSRLFDEFLGKITAGSTITHLYQKDFLTFRFAAPLLIEQIAIAQMLYDMDRDIESVQAHLDKTKTIKQGMMQELLTGNTRLI